MYLPLLRQSVCLWVTLTADNVCDRHPITIYKQSFLGHRSRSVSGSRSSPQAETQEEGLMDSQVDPEAETQLTEEAGGNDSQVDPQAETQVVETRDRSRSGSRSRSRSRSRSNSRSRSRSKSRGEIR